MGTLIDKLNYLDDTKQIFKDKATLCGQYFDDNTHFRNYFNWLDPLCNAAQKYGTLSSIEGSTFQSHFPTQNNPVLVQTSAGECLVGINRGDFPCEDEFYNCWEQESTTGESCDFPSPRVYWVEDAESPFYHGLPWVYTESQIFIAMNYTFSLGDFDFTPVSFKVYISNKEDSDQYTEIYDSNGALSGQIYYSYLADDNYHPQLKFETANGENFSIVFSDAQAIVEYLSLEKNIDLQDKEMIDIIRRAEYGSSNSDHITFRNSQNYFNKDDDYIVGGEWQYTEVESDDWGQDSYYVITPDSQEDYTVTPLETGVRISCKKTNGSCNVLYTLDSDFHPIAHGGSAYIESLVNIVGDRIPKIGMGRLYSTDPLIVDWYSETSVIDNNKIIFSEGYPAAEGEEYPMVIALFCDAGPNATENDYIDFTNLQCFKDFYVWGDFHNTPVVDNKYVSYKNGFYQVMTFDKNSATKVFDGTENGWTCTATEIPGVYAMELEEDPNNPWYGYHTEEEEEDWDPETGESIYITVDVYGESICSHFIPAHYRDKIAPGYYSFYGDSIIFYTDQQTSLQEWLAWLNENNITLYYETGYLDEDTDTYRTGIPGQNYEITSQITKQNIENLNKESTTQTVNTWLHNLESMGSSGWYD